MDIDTLINARWIVPVEPQGIVHENAALAIKDGRIVDIVPQTETAHFRPAVTLDLNGHAVLPGLINTHGHAAMSLMRGLADDLPLMEWLQQHVWPAEQQWVGPEFVRDGSLLACAEMLRSGTTCFNDMYFFPEQTAEAAELAHMRATIGMIMVDFPSAWAQDADDYLHKGLALHDKLKNNTLLTTAFAPHAPYTVSDAPLKKLLMYAEELDRPIHMHVHESADEVHNAEREHGQRPLARLKDLGLLGPRLLAVHMTQLTPDEIAECGELGVNVVHCPESNLKLASGFCPVQQLAAAGCNVALGTDGAASNNDLDMFGEMRTAALLGKATANDASALSAESVLRMATINAARALGLDNDIGSLQTGKSADLIAVDLGTIETQPVYHPVSQLVYSTARNQVTDVWVAGRHVLKDRQLTTLDEKELLERAAYWQVKLTPVS
jgi:5-methylthioadenosine/S-adenosylhomocysteine deaminase